MPVRSVGGGCYKWGGHGKRYCGKGARAKAAKQGAAAHAAGYKGDSVIQNGVIVEQTPKPQVPR